MTAPRWSSVTVCGSSRVWWATVVRRAWRAEAALVPSGPVAQGGFHSGRQVERGGRYGSRGGPAARSAGLPRPPAGSRGGTPGCPRPCAAAGGRARPRNRRPVDPVGLAQDSLRRVRTAQGVRCPPCAARRARSSAPVPSRRSTAVSRNGSGSASAQADPPRRRRRHRRRPDRRARSALSPPARTRTALPWARTVAQAAARVVGPAVPPPARSSAPWQDQPFREAISSGE